jgi:nucleoside 2-deoxyribosyltransferase
VAYEIGYAIGRGKSAILVKNKSIATDETELKRVMRA